MSAESFTIALPPEAVSELAEALGATGAATMYMSASIVGALAQRGLLEQRAVAVWAKFFAVNLPPTRSEGTRDAIAAQLAAFADLVEALAARPDGAGRA